MLSAIPAYLCVADGGFSGATCREMAMRSGAKDQKGIKVIFQSTWVLLIIVTIITVLLTTIFLQLAPLADWLRFTILRVFEIKIVFILLVVHVLIGFQGDLLNGCFWVTGHYPIGMYLIAFTQLIEFIFFSLSVFMGGGPVQAAAWYLIGRIIGTALMWIFQHRVTPSLRIGFTHANFSEIKRLGPPAFTSLAFPLGTAFNIQGMRLIIGMTIGPSAVRCFHSITHFNSHSRATWSNCQSTDTTRVSMVLRCKRQVPVSAYFHQILPSLPLVWSFSWNTRRHWRILDISSLDWWCHFHALANLLYSSIRGDNQ